MSYYFILNQPVFLTFKHLNEIREELAKKDDRFIYTSIVMFFSLEQKKEAEELILKYLEAKYDENPLNFLNEWVNFELFEKEAQDNLWTLLNDYSSYYGHSYISDTRSDWTKVLNDMTGDSSTYYPMGNEFLLNYLTKPYKWYHKYSKKLRNNYVSKFVKKIPINISKVIKVNGNPLHFAITFDDGTILNLGSKVF